MRCGRKEKKIINHLSLYTPGVLLIYTQGITPRLSYIVDALFLGNAELTTDKSLFIQHTGARINYADEKIEGTLQIIPSSLLAETGIRHQDVACSVWKGLKIFFQTDGDIPFDIFSASFYLLSRYEEYLPHDKDQYERYAHTNSLAYKEDFLQQPLINLWLEELLKVLIFSFPADFRFIPTYDIDIAFRYLDQPLIKNLLGFYKDLLTGNFEQVMERGNVYSGRQKDPFDVYDWLDSLHDELKLQPVYFFLLAAKHKGVDQNVDPSKKSMKKLIKRHAEKYTTGIHPSWQSNADKNIFKKEIALLESVTGRKTIYSRQHYLKMNLPGTYRKLIVTGITDDYSMAYGTVNGFRASYCRPFRWFDLERNETTVLTVHGFCYMDSTAVFQQKHTVEMAEAELHHFYKLIKALKGEMVTLFHNDFLTEQRGWVEWRKMYEQFLRQVVY